MRKILIFFLLSLITFITLPNKSYAEENIAASSASFTNTLSNTTRAADNRAKILQHFLAKYNSPLASYAESFIKHADAHGLDWKLVAAISGVESTFGLAEPLNCNNAWGYNIYGSHVRCFATYDEAISVVSRDLRELYMNHWKASDIYAIGKIYAGDTGWAGKVDHFMNQIQLFAQENDQKPLTITL